VERKEPAYRRSWTRVRNFRAEYSYRQLVRQHDLSGVPTVLVRQFAAVSVRAHQLDRQIAEIEKRTPLVTDMDDAVYTRWCFLISEFRRYADSLDKLAKTVFAKRESQAVDIFTLMNRDVETVEPGANPDPVADAPESVKENSSSANDRVD
jgi:hypothetical protein